MKRFTLFFFAVCLAGAGTRAGLLSTNQPYVEVGGFAGGEAENYHGLFTGQGVSWTELVGGVFASSRYGRYLQALPDTGTMMTYAGGTAGPGVDYRIEINTPGTYRLWLRWDGVDASSDSLFAGIVELGDGAGGVPDWYEYSGHSDANFNTDDWVGLGGAEENGPVASQNPVKWTIETPGIYTLRVVPREDGAAIDSWILQRDSLPDPSGNGAPLLADDALTLNLGAVAAVPVLENDTGFINGASLAVVSGPTFGTAMPQANGTLLYTHTTGTPTTDTFMYEAADIGGAVAAAATVTLTFSSALRLPAATVRMPVDSPPTVFDVVDALPGVTFQAPTSMDTPPGDSNTLFVCQRNGLIYVVPDVTAASPSQQVFLNLSALVEDDGNEMGLKGIAFHPGYATNRYFYVTYNHFTGLNRVVRLSRFETQSGNPLAAELSSQVVLIEQINDNTIHNIADVSFGPDKYLYFGVGDEGPQDDGGNNSQRIDKDIWSALVRIDVDKRPGNPEPTAHPAILSGPGGLARISIPADNPFIGATSFNGSAVSPAQVRTEFYAVGFRNPWQFSFDSATGEIWLGDVGNNAWEEVDVVTAGGNYGWAFFEGNASGPKSPPGGFTSTAPVWDYPHGGGAFEGFSVTGGLVYRGGAYTGLAGKYVCADFVTGNIWTIERTGSETNVVRIAGEGGIVQFGLDPATGEILMLDLGDGRVRRLVEETSDGFFPQVLSQTGFFAELTDLTPNPGVVPYDVNLPFWSDYAIKRRWFALTNLTDQVGYDRDAPWGMPPGMMWVKHFDVPLDRDDPAMTKRIETRVLVVNSNVSYGVSYRWNEDGTDAVLVPEAGVSFDLAVTNGGMAATQTWQIPSRAQCLVCHTPSAGRALSFNTRQLNAEGALAGQVGNQLDLLAQAGYLDGVPGSPNLLPRHVGPDETQYSLEARARSYLAVNCGYCHTPGSGSAPGSWDGRHPRTLTQTKLVRGVANNSGVDPANRLIVPGDLLHSILYNRIAATNGFSRMPPLATGELDEVNVQLIADWIAELTSRQTYAEWRLVEFGSAGSPEGERGVDADGDLQDNETEWLTRTDPEDPGSFWSGDIGVIGNGPAVGVELFNREVVVERSSNLVEWTTWDVPGNDGIPLATGVVNQIEVPVAEDEEFFRFRVRER